MGQVLHGSATTTGAVRRAIQHGQENLRALAKRYGVDRKTVATWRNRTSVADVPTGPREPKSTVLTPDEEAMAVAFRRHTLLPLDDCLLALQPTIPNLTRSCLHRYLQRHGISHLSEVDGDLSAKQKFKSYPIGAWPGPLDRWRARAPRQIDPAPHRHRRGADRRGQAPCLRGH